MPKYLMQAVSSGGGGDGTLKTWQAASPDWAAVGFPGPGTAAHVAVSSVVGEDLTGGIADDSVGLGKLQNIGVGLLGNDSGTANPKLITIGTGLAFIAGALALATIADQRMLGNISGGTASPIALTASQVTTFVASSSGNAAHVLHGDGSWSAPSASATPGGTTGQLQWNSTGSMAGTTAITTDGTRLIFGSGATLGLIGVANNVDILYGKTNGGADVKLIGSVDASSVWRLGDNSQLAKVYIDTAAGGELALWFASTQRYSLADSKFEFTQVGSASGTANNAFRVNAGAHAAFTANTEVRDATFNLNRTVTLLAGTIANQRSIRINPVTLTSAGAVSVTGIAATLSIEGPPVASASGGVAPTFTNVLALEIQSGALGFGSAPARVGTTRYMNGDTVYARDAADGFDRRVIEMAANITFGHGHATEGHGGIYFDTKTAGFFAFRNAFTDILVMADSVGLDLKSHPIFGVTTLKGNILDEEVDDGNSGTSKTLDFSNSGPAHKLTLTGNCTLTLTAPAQHKWLQITLVQDATGGRTLTWPASVKWANGVQPSWITTANAINVASLYWNGTTYLGVGSAGFA